MENNTPFPESVDINAHAAATQATPAGRYRHYKGNNYEVIGIAFHSETHELMVVYRPEYGEKKLWVRPLAMFQETVTLDTPQGGTQQVLRFTPLIDL